MSCRWLFLSRRSCIPRGGFSDILWSFCGIPCVRQTTVFDVPCSPFQLQYCLSLSKAVLPSHPKRAIWGCHDPSLFGKMIFVDVSRQKRCYEYRVISKKNGVVSTHDWTTYFFSFLLWSIFQAIFLSRELIRCVNHAKKLVSGLYVYSYLIFLD